MPSDVKYFLGLALPDNLREAVVNFQHNYQSQRTEPHITLKAPCGLNSGDTWFIRAQQLCQETAPLHIQVTRTGNFGSSVLYLQVDCPALISMHNNLVVALDISAADQAKCFEGPLYSPHLTLLQAKDTNPTLFGRAVELAATHFVPYSFEATSVTVYRKLPYQPRFTPWAIIDLRPQ